MKIEYLITVKQNDTFCTTKEAFLNFLQVDSSIEVTEDTIKFSHINNSHIFETKFSIQTEEIPSKKERYYHLILQSDKENCEQEFTKLADKIREITLRINPASTHIHTLWNDIGRQYVIRAYPLINEVENLMRKLISKFMLVNVGMDWSKEAIHSDILKKVEDRHDNEDSYLNILHKTDFIHLSDVLFRKYRALDLNKLDRILLNESFSEEIFENIKKILPKSNWERHFSDIIQYDENNLKDKWKLLYELRNDVAHNRYISQSDFFKIKGITEEIKQILNEAINKLDKIDLTEEDKKDILISYQTTPELSQEYLVEEAVEKWYLEKYPAAAIHKLRLPKRYFDFSLECEDGFKIAIKTKLYSDNNFFRLCSFVTRRIIPKVLEMISENEISEFYFVFVINNFINLNMEFIQRIMYRIDDLQQRTASTQIKFITGYLDNDNQFVEFNIEDIA